MLRWLLGGGAVPILLMGSGLFFAVYLGLSPLRHPCAMLRAMRSKEEGSGVSPFRAVMLALAGTLGVGNIVGVANAIAVGGAGAVFWMWVSALIAMLLKYAEIVLAVLHRREQKGRFFGGAVYYIRDLFNRHRLFYTGAVVATLFAALLVINALSMGCVIQSNAVAMAFEGVIRIPAWLTGLVLVALTLPVIIKGAQGISALTEILVPIMTAGYVILSVAVLILRSDAVGEALYSIFYEAFSFESVGGGVFGFFTSQAIRVGTMRGLLSNEAGCGTAPTAHAAAGARSAGEQGVWGIFEVFVDTILLCTATALVILVSLPQLDMTDGNAVMLTLRAYSCVLGPWAEYFLSAGVFCFGYATLLCWANYGLESLMSISRRRCWRYIYFFVFEMCILVGCHAAPDSVWVLSDFAIAALTTVNLVVLILSRGEIKEETKLRFDRKP